MFLKPMTITVMISALAWQTVQASSISTRVRVLEHNVSQFERQANQERAQQKSQTELVNRNTEAIQALTVRVDGVQQKIDQISMTQEPGHSGKGRQSHHDSDPRFTDSRYSFP